ncbi:MAG: glucose dehydrogenase, partial [Sphingobacterium sp.]|nr:glucose dehydrogenase [Sphingobacterium sp.]
MIKVRLRPIVSRINLPTVLKTTILPGDSIESIFFATQVGEIFCIRNGVIEIFLDIRPQILKLGTSS